MCVMGTSGHLVHRQSSQKHGALPPPQRPGSWGTEMLTEMLALRRLSLDTLPFTLLRLSSQGGKGRPMVTQVSILSRGGGPASLLSMGPSLHQAPLPAASDKTCPFPGPARLPPPPCTLDLLHQPGTVLRGPGHTGELPETQPVLRVVMGARPSEPSPRQASAVHGAEPGPPTRPCGRPARRWGPGTPENGPVTAACLRGVGIIAGSTQVCPGVSPKPHGVGGVCTSPPCRPQ